jgi:hypothetical protein
MHQSVWANAETWGHWNNLFSHLQQVEVRILNATLLKDFAVLDSMIDLRSSGSSICLRLRLQSFCSLLMRLLLQHEEKKAAKEHRDTAQTPEDYFSFDYRLLSKINVNTSIGRRVTASSCHVYNFIG